MYSAQTAVVLSALERQFVPQSCVARMRVEVVSGVIQVFSCAKCVHFDSFVKYIRAVGGKNLG